MDATKNKLDKEQILREFDTLTIKDDFIFGATFESHPKLCRQLLEIILDIKIKEIRYLESEKTIDKRTDAKGIRLDIYVEEEGTDRSFDIEMQVLDKYDLGKRMRYYQGLMDMDKLKVGDKYTNLGESFIIFICLFDPFKRGLRKYTFRETCEEDQTIRLGDGSMKVVLNAEGRGADGSNAIKELLNYVRDREIGESKFIRELDAAVEETKRAEKWRLEYVKLSMLLAERREEDLKEGREEGINKLAALMRRLFAEGRIEEAQRVAEDEQFRAELLKQYD